MKINGQKSMHGDNVDDIPAHIVWAMLDHADSEFPCESCGVLAETGKGLIYFPCRNLAVRNQEFNIHPEDQVRASMLGKIIAIVHSHPNGTTKMSESDKVMFRFSQFDWIIVSWPEGKMKRYYKNAED